MKLRFFSPLYLFTFSIVGCALVDPPPSNPKVVRALSVGKHASVIVNTWDIDNWFRSGTELLEEKNCFVSLQRKYPVDVFVGDGLNVIERIEQYEELYKLSYDVIVVEKIGFCGGRGQFAGCARIGGPIVISKEGAEKDDLTLLHEYGHVRGLLHSKKDPNNIMYESHPVGRDITSEQCEAFKK